MTDEHAPHESPLRRLLSEQRPHKATSPPEKDEATPFAGDEHARPTVKNKAIQAVDEAHMRPTITGNADIFIQPDQPNSDPDEAQAAISESQAQAALQRLRDKMAETAAQFASGKLNRAQFNAIYSRYNEQRQITEKLLERNPDTTAWQPVMQEGHTSFLREHYAAHIRSYALYDNKTSLPITSHGKFKMDTALLVPMLSTFRNATTEMLGSSLKSTEIESGGWVVFVAGDTTTAIVIFSLEPSETQLRLVQDLHRDFEHANQHALARGVRDPAQMVFPQRALFE